MVSGKCWVYRRATLHIPDMPPKIIDYSDGTEPFNCNTVSDSGNYPVYEWKLPGEVIPIPLNIPRNNVDSILRKGVIEYPDGEIHWEYIFGKFRTHPQFYLQKLPQFIPFIVIILILLFLCLLNFFNKRN